MKNNSIKRIGKLVTHNAQEVSKMHKKRCLQWCSALLLLSSALLALVGCPDTPTAQIDITAPEPITISTANIRTSPSSITLQWEPSPSNDVAAIRITWESTDGSQSGERIITDPTQTTFTIEDLDPSVAYVFRITTIDTANNISDIVEIIATTSSTVYPVTFAQESYFFTNIEVDPGSTVGTLPEPTIDIDPNDANSPDIAVIYAITENTDDDGALFAIDPATAQITVGDSTLDATREYTFTVAATSSQGITATAAVIVVPRDTTPPDPVTNVNTTTDSNSTVVTLTWDDSDSVDATFVRITWVHDASGTTGGPIRVAYGVGTARITGLISDAHYTITLEVEDGAVNDQGILTPNVSASVPTSVTTSDIVAPAAVTMATATPHANGSEVELTWRDSTSSDATQVLITWEVTGTGIEAGTQTAFHGDEAATIRGLTSETNYTFFLIVKDDAGISSSAVMASTTTLDATAPPPVPAANATPDADGSTVVLNWNDPASADLDHIEITWRRSDGAGVSGGPITVPPNIQTRTITGLTSETDYIFTLVAVDSTGNRSKGFDITGTTADITAPNAATGLTATAVCRYRTCRSGVDPL